MYVCTLKHTFIYRIIKFIYFHSQENMKFGVKLLDSVNITHFTHIVATVAKLCAKSSNDKSCTLKLTSDSVYFILPEFASNNIGSGGFGRTSFWMSLDPKCFFDFFIVEGT